MAPTPLSPDSFTSVPATVFDLAYFQTIGMMKEELLAAVPLFIFMAAVLERAGIIEELFDVSVVNVNIVKVQPKPKRRGVTKGVRPGWKKAVVQLKAGDSIEIFEGAQV